MLTNDFNFNADFPQQEAEKQSAAQDASSWHDTKAVLDGVRDFSKSAASHLESLGEGIVQQSPIGAYKAAEAGKSEDIPGLTGAAVRATGLTKDKFAGTMGQGFYPMAVAGASAAEWWGIGKVAGMAEAAAAPFVKPLTPLLKGIFSTAAKSVGVQLGEEQGTALATRTLASTAVGGAIAPAYAEATKVATGDKRPVAVAPNVALGMLFGFIGGMFSPGTRDRIARQMDDIHGGLGTTEQGGIKAFDALSKQFAAGNDMAPHEAAARVARVMVGKGSDVDRVALEQLHEANPALFEHPLLRPLAEPFKQAAADSEFGDAAMFGVRVPDEDIVNSMFDAMQAKNPVDSLFQGQHPGSVLRHTGEETPLTDRIAATGVNEPTTLRPTGKETPLTARTKAAVKVVDIGKATAMRRPLQERIGQQLAANAAFGFETTTVERPEFTVPTGPRVIDLTPGQVIRGPQTAAGTPMASGSTEYLLPFGRTQLDIPAAPKLITQQLTTGQRKILGMVGGTDHAAFEKYVARNQSVRQSLARLVVSGYFDPADITAPNMARVVASELRGIADDLPLGDVDHRDQLFEVADDFSRRQFHLTGEEPPTGLISNVGRSEGEVAGNLARGYDPNRFVREPATGDIVRTTGNGDGTTDVIDKKGRRATMRDKDAPQHILAAPLRSERETPFTFKTEPELEQPKASANELKKIEAAVNGSELPTIGIGPTPGPVPVPPKIAELKAAVTERKEIPGDIYGRTQEEFDAGFKKFRKAAATPAAENVGPAIVDTHAVAAESGFSRVQTKAGATAYENYSTGGKLVVNPDGSWKYGSGRVGEDAEALSKFLQKSGLRGFSKGAISIPRGTRMNDGAAALLMNRLGGELWQVPQGFVTKDPVTGAERVWPSQQHAFEYAKRFTTISRMAAENDQVVADSVAHVDPTAKQLKKLATVRAKAAKLPVADIGKVADNAAKMAKQEGAEAAPLAIRRGYISAKSKFLGHLIRQHARLMTFGDGGRQLANLSKQYSATQEMVYNYIMQKGGESAKLLRTLTNGDEIEAGSAHPEALRLYDEVIGSINDEVYDTAKTLGVDVEPRIAGKRYFHHHFSFKGSDIPANLIEEAQNLGIGNTPDEVARALDAPEAAIAEPQQRTAATIGDRMAKIQWAREKATAISGSLEKQRRGNVGYTKDIYTSFIHKANEDARRIASAAVFGPKLEAIDENIYKVMRNSGFATEDMHTAWEIMNDVRGRLHIPQSDAIRNTSNAMRFWLSTAGPKHSTQNALLVARYGFTKFGWNAFNTLTHGAFGKDLSFARENAITVGWNNFELGEDPEQFLRERPAEDIARLHSWAAKAKLPEMARLMGNAGTAGLHVFLNATRINAARLAKTAFPRLLTKALAGDADSLAVLSETMHSKLSPEVLQSLDHDMLQKQFAKNTADWAGMTYHPEDMPALARHPVGAQALRFRVFQWNLVHNIWHEMTNPNFSWQRRAATRARMLLAVPILASLDPVLRHHTGTGTVDSEVAYDAMERFLKDPTGAHGGKAAYAAMMLSVHGGLFGIMDSAIQGFNLMNPDLIARSFSADPAIFAPYQSGIAASAWAAHGVFTGNRKALGKGIEETLRLLGPTGTMVERRRGKVRPVRLPKKMVLREATGAGP